MHSLTANEAKTQFGDLLLKAQREPVQINRNGKPVAIVMSMEDYQALEELKLTVLRQKLAIAAAEENAGQTLGGDQFFEQLLSGKLD